MTTIALVACAKTKELRATHAASLYKSPLFRKSILYGLSHADRTYILSAKHGLLPLHEIVAPYDVTLKSLGPAKRVKWADLVTGQLEKIIKPRDRIIVLAGREYYRELIISLARKGCRIEFPLGSLSLGNRISRLIDLNSERALDETVALFYKTLKELYDLQSKGRRLADCSGKMDWPKRGVYFFLEDERESQKSIRRFGMPRVIRVGTHAVSEGSKTTLWDRLSTHRGTSEGLGSHRSSIFRLHVGRAFVEAIPSSASFVTWGVGQSAPAVTRKSEAVLERQVSEIIGAMKVIWLEVPDSPMASSDRAFIERNAIGVLSRQNLVTGMVPSSWLGNHSPEYRIALSGLWNLNHLFCTPHEAFATVFQHYVDIALKRKPAEVASVAPGNWNRITTPPDSSAQYNMFDNESVQASKDPI